MVGSNLCRWTISYFWAAIVWLIASELLMVGGLGFPNAGLMSADTLVIVHMVCIGWLSLAMCGAIATLGIVQELIRARQLADVAQALRLPTGVSAPWLLVSRN